MQVGLLEPDNFSAAARAKLALVGDVHAWNGAQRAEFLAPLHVLFVRLAHRIDEMLLQQAPRLRWVCSPTTGHDHIDELALGARGIHLISLRGERAFLETIRATPEHTFGLMLSLLRRYRLAFSDTLEGRWDRDACRGEELFRNRVGIIGLGRVGFRVASYCSAFGAKVFWCDPAPVTSVPEWTRVESASDLIDAARIVVLCASHTKGQRPILGEPEIHKLAGRYFVNTARGELVDERCLLAAIRDNRLAGVATDVVAEETGANTLAEWRSLAPGRNVVLTPHIGGATIESMARTEEFLVDKLRHEIERRGMGCDIE